MNSVLKENKFLQILSKAYNNKLEIGSILKSLEKETYHKIILHENMLCLIKCNISGDIIDDNTKNAFINIENDIIKGNTFSYIKSWIIQFELVSKTDSSLEIKIATEDDNIIKDTNMEVENLYIITYKKQLVGFCNLQEIENFDTSGFDVDILDEAFISNRKTKNYLYFLDTYNSQLTNEIIKKIYEIMNTHVIVTESYQIELEDWQNRGGKIYKKVTNDSLYCVVLKKSDLILNEIFRSKLKFKFRQYDIMAILNKIELDLKKIIDFKQDYCLNRVIIESDSMEKDWNIRIEIKENRRCVNREFIHCYSVQFISNNKYAPSSCISSELLNLYGINNVDIIPKYFNSIFKDGRYAVS